MNPLPKTGSFVETEPGFMSEEEAHVSRGDQRKAMFEFLRHIATLDSGALILVVTLVEKVFSQPAFRPAVAVAVAMFLASLTFSGFAYLVGLSHYPRVGVQRMTSRDRQQFVTFLSITFSGFLLGMISLAVFFVANWFR